MLGHPRDSIEVLIYQLVQLTRGGEAAKMSKRRGDVVFLDEFVDEIGVDAARWYLLSRGHDQTIEIDIDLAAEKSQKNPNYYVWACARPHRRAGARNAEGRFSSEPRPSAPLATEERDLVKLLLELPLIVREATVRRAPHAIPTYAIRVADDFHRSLPPSPRSSSRRRRHSGRALCVATRDVVATCLDLIGVEAPERSTTGGTACAARP